MFEEKMTIHCFTEEAATSLLRMLAAEGIGWNGGEDPLEFVPFNPRTGTWYSITRRNSPLRGSILVITYSHSDPHYVGYQRVEYTDLLRVNRAIQSITSIEAFV